MFEKKYNPQSIQQNILHKQNRKKLFASKPPKKNGEKNTVTLLSGPILLDPQETSYGQLIQTIKEDSIVRYYRMLGKNCKRHPYFGYETNNKPIEKNKHESLQKQKERYIKQMMQMGIGCDPEEIQDMRHPTITRKIRNFIDHCMQKGWIKQDIAINYRCNHRQTNIASDEITWKKAKCKLYSLRYFVDTKNITLLVKTTTPETIFGDVALAVNPEDRRYKKLIGHKVIIPMINKTIPIIGDESVDSMKHDGVMRVTPCHDVWSLEIAKKHKLNVKSFAIDHNGCFTHLAGDFANKKVVDFFDNIIQNIDDIHNLESIQTIEQEVPTSKHVGEKLEPILSTQRFFAPPAEILGTPETENFLGGIEIYPHMYHELREKTAENITHNCRPISKKEATGIQLPMRENDSETYMLSESKIMNLPSKKIKNKKIIPTLLIFNLICDHHIKEDFSVEELIEVMMTAGEDRKILGELYMDMFTTDLPRGYKSEINEFLKLFEYANKESKGLVNYEKFASQLVEILDKAACIINKKGGKYFFDVASMMNADQGLQISNEKIDNNLATSVILLEDTGISTQTAAEKSIFFGEEKEKNMILKTSILSKTMYKKLPVQDICIFPNTIHCSKETREEISKKRGADALRLQSILQDEREGGRIREDEGEKYLAFINKVRNACRYIFMTHIDDPKRRKPLEFDLEEIGTYIDKRLNKLEANEYRMLCRIKDLYTELPDCVNKNTLAELGKKIIDCAKKDFCDKYLEIIKIRETEYTQKIAIFCVGTLLQILHPMAPFFTEAVWGLFNFTGTIHQQKYTTFLGKATKNYKTQLFMDIIDKCSTLRERTQHAKHEKVDIAFQASIDFLHYIKKNEDIVNKLVNTNDIVYADNERDIQKYETDTIIDVTIGIKGVSKPLKHVDGRDERAHQLEKKQARLQEIRSLTAQLSLDKKNKKIVEAKKAEMLELKKDIEKLEFEIKKSKMNEK